MLFNDGPWPAQNSRWWTDNGQTVPAGYVYLSPALEKAPCLYLIPVFGNDLLITVLESCYALRNVAEIDMDGIMTYHDEIYQRELAQGDHWSTDYSYTDSCYGLKIANGIAIGSGNVIIEGTLDPYYKLFFNAFWEDLGLGNSAYSAFNYALFVAHNSHVDNYTRARGNIGYFSSLYLTANP